MKKQAFTLIELLVVIAIIAILAAILFPVFAQAKAAAVRTTSLSNVKQITLAQILYLNDYNDTVAMNRDCNITFTAGGAANQVPCVVGRGMRGWIDLTVPYIKNYDIFKSGADGQNFNPLPPGTLHWDGSPLGAREGLIWGPRGAQGTDLIGGEFRTSYGRNNNFANNGVYTANLSQATHPSNLILIFSHTANSGAGAAGNEGVSGSAYTVVRRAGVFPEPGECMSYGVGTGRDNNRANFLNILPAGFRDREGANPPSERYNGGGLYGMADGSARSLRPEQVKGQCNWGSFGLGGVEFGNNGTGADFRF